MPITPVHWGGFKWLGIHVTCYYIDIVFGRNLKRQEMLHDWVHLSAFMLPCGICENHFLHFQRENPLPEVKEYEPGETPYLRWSIRAHNAVRERQRKPLMDEDVVVLAYKSGKMYGADQYLAHPKSRTNLASTSSPVAALDSSTDLSGNYDSDLDYRVSALTSQLKEYQIATYVLSGILGALAVFAVIYLAVQFLSKRPISELSE